MLNRNKTGLALGSLIGLMHLVWSVLIFFGWGQSYLDFVFNMHSLMNPMIVTDFSLGRSVGLIVITTLVGYVVGFVFATIWNKVHR